MKRSKVISQSASPSDTEPKKTPTPKKGVKPGDDEYTDLITDDEENSSESSYSTTRPNGDVAGAGAGAGASSKSQNGRKKSAENDRRFSIDSTNSDKVTKDKFKYNMVTHITVIDILLISKVGRQ